MGRQPGPHPQIPGVWEQDVAVSGADKVSSLIHEGGVRVARCPVEPLMADMGLQGPAAGTGADPEESRPARPARRLVERRLRARAPNRLGVAATSAKTHLES